MLAVEAAASRIRPRLLPLPKPANEGDLDVSDGSQILELLHALQASNASSFATIESKLARLEERHEAQEKAAVLAAQVARERATERAEAAARELKRAEEREAAAEAKVKAHETRIEALERTIQRVVWVSLGAGLAGGSTGIALITGLQKAGILPGAH